MGRVTNMLLSDGGSTTYGYDAIGTLNSHTPTNFTTTAFGCNPASQIISRTVTNSRI